MRCGRINACSQKGTGVLSFYAMPHAGVCERGGRVNSVDLTPHVLMEPV